MILARGSVQAKKKAKPFPDKNQVSFAELVCGSVQVGKKSKKKKSACWKVTFLALLI
jgi:hypothetical protein